MAELGTIRSFSDQITIRSRSWPDLRSFFHQNLEMSVIGSSITFLGIWSEKDREIQNPFHVIFLTVNQSHKNYFPMESISSQHVYIVHDVNWVQIMQNRFDEIFLQFFLYFLVHFSNHKGIQKDRKRIGKGSQIMNGSRSFFQIHWIVNGS